MDIKVELEKKVKPVIENGEIKYVVSPDATLPSNPDNRIIELENSFFITVYVDAARNLKLIDNKTAYKLGLLNISDFYIDNNGYFIISDEIVINLEKSGYNIIYKIWSENLGHSNRIGEVPKANNSSEEIEKLMELKQELLEGNENKEFKVQQNEDFLNKGSK